MNVTTNELITNLATQLQISSMKVFELFVSIQQIKAAFNIVSIFIIIVIFGLILPKVFKSSLNDAEDPGIAMVVTSFIAFLIALIYMLFTYIILNNVLILFVPEYGALLEIIRLLKGY